MALLGISRHVRLLWHQRTKHRNQFGRRDIVESNDLGHVFRFHRALVVHDRHREERASLLGTMRITCPLRTAV